MSAPVEKGRVIGIGGVFFKTPDKQKLQAWYRDRLGMMSENFLWRDHGDPQIERLTVWSPFPADSNYFAGPSMINYIVDDLDALLARLERDGVCANPKREDHDYGRFAWIQDPDGNPIELWEPRGA